MWQDQQLPSHQRKGMGGKAKRETAWCWPEGSGKQAGVAALPHSRRNSATPAHEPPRRPHSLPYYFSKYSRSTSCVPSDQTKK